MPIGDGTRAAVRTAQAVEADDEEAGGVKRSTATDQRSPPVAHVGAAGQRVADDHDVVARVDVELAMRAVGDGHVAERLAGLEGEGGDDGDVLVRNQGGEGVFRLRGRSLFGI